MMLIIYRFINCLFYYGLCPTTLTHNKRLSQIIHPNRFPKSTNLEVSIFLYSRNMTTKFLRHHFLNCPLKYSASSIIELVRTTDMIDELEPELEELPKFN